MNRLSILSCIVIILLPACSSIKNVFPDKQETYKDSRELPPLEVPPDLTTTSILDRSDGPPDASGSASYSDLLNSGSTEGSSETAETNRALLISLGVNDTYLEVNEYFPQAWRLVGKALSNLEIEVADRNRSIGMYYILYEDPELSKKSDQGFWDRVFFWRDVEIKAREKQFRVKLEGSGEKTNVFVMNTAGEKLSEGTGLKLLNMMDKNLNKK